jgi:hypothetical protein
VPELHGGPTLRHVGQADATIRVETDEPCRVDIFGEPANTFEDEGHHFVLVCIEGLGPGIERVSGAGISRGSTP